MKKSVEILMQSRQKGFSAWPFRLRHKLILCNPKCTKITIVLHGRGDSIRPFFHIHEELNLGSGMNYLLLNARRRFDTGFSWYTEAPTIRQTLPLMRNEILKIVDYLARLGYPYENIFLLGYSQGGLLSADVALHSFHRLGGVIVVSGYFHFFPRWKLRINKAQRQTPWLVVHGTEDDILPFDETAYGVKKLTSAGVQIHWKPIYKDHSMGEEDAQLIKKWYKGLSK